MKAETGLVSNIKIKKNKDGKQPVRLLQCVISDPDDVQTVEWINAPGRDSGIIAGDTVLIVTVGSTKFAIADDYGVEPTAQGGEEKWFSRDAGGAKAAEIILKEDSSIEINGNNDFIISFNSLKSILDTFITNLNLEFTNVATAINSIVPLTYTPTTITLDITPAKVADVKIGN
jgi:hypothetical protein